MPAATEPYVQGRAVRNDRWVQQERQVWNWQIMTGVMTLFALGGYGAFIYVLTQQQIIPLLVQVDGKDRLLSAVVVTAETMTAPRESLIQQDLIQTIEDVRGLSGSRRHKRKAFERSSFKFVGAGAAYVEQYYTDHSPDDEIKKYTIEIPEVSALPEPGNIWRLEWVEERYEKDTNRLVERSHWKGSAMVEIHLSDKPQIREQNPWGITIPKISWTKTKEDTL